DGGSKTAPVLIISGLLPPRTGSIRFEGEDSTGLRPDQVLARGIAQVREGRRLFASMNVGENLLMGGYGHRSGVQQGLQRAYALFPVLRERRLQDASTLSGGEQQMCGITR